MRNAFVLRLLVRKPLKLLIKLTRALLESSSQMRDSLYAVVVFLILKAIQDLRNQMLINNARTIVHSDCDVGPTCSTLQQTLHSYGLLTGLGATLRVQDRISQFPNII